MWSSAQIQMVSEAPGHPRWGSVATKFECEQRSGLGLDTMDFFASLLAAKNVQSLRIVGNVGVGILSDPTSGNRQNDVLTCKFPGEADPQAELGEVNGRVNMRNGTAFPGTDSSSMVQAASGSPGSVRFDGGVMFGLTDDGPTISRFFHRFSTCSTCRSSCLKRITPGCPLHECILTLRDELRVVRASM
jgi:hypothetical protein